VSEGPLWFTLQGVSQGLLAAGVVAGLATVAWCQWQFRRGRGEVHRRSIPGMSLVALAALVSLAGNVARYGTPPRFSVTGSVALGFGLVGFVTLLRARRPSRRA
jgi:hypothetical protein